MSAALANPVARSMPVSVSFFAAGCPSTKGSARAFVVGGRAIITNDAGKKAKTWASIVSGKAHDMMNGCALLTGALVVHIVFYMPRPKAHSTKRGLRPDAPRWCWKKPDVDKLARCALDALTGVVFFDDAQIARLVLEKRYTLADGAAGAEFEVREIVSDAVQNSPPYGG